MTPAERARNEAAAPAGCGVVMIAILLGVVAAVCCAGLHISGALPWQHDKPHGVWVTPTPTQTGDR